MNCIVPIIRFLVVGIFFLVVSSVNAQVIKTLNQPESGNKSHIARDKVEFDPGYDYSPSNSMEAYLNKSIIGSPNYVNLWDNASFNSRNINESLPIGYTIGVPNVSPTGGATYSIPISVPQGTNGMSPAVSINYNSQMGEGMLGTGWDLTGLSVISRAPKNIFNNNKVESVQLNNSDAFSIDGNRLIPVSGNNGNNGTVYKTELESFSKITSTGNVNGSPEWFKIETQDGKEIEYGRVANARFSSEQGKVMLWRIYRIKDTYGNYIEFRYREENRESLIDEIVYTGNMNTGLSPYAKLKFLYNEKTDHNLIFIAGSHVRTNVLLKEIEVTIQNSLFKRYVLEYGYDLHSFLNSINEFDADNKQLNATIFKYGDKNQDFLVANSSVISGQSIDIFPLDFNGDGYTDLFGAEYTYAAGAIKEYFQFKWYKNNKYGGYTLHTSTNVSGEGLQVIGDPSDGQVFPNFINFASADFNGNGLDDVAVPKIRLEGQSVVLDKIRIYLDGFSNISYDGYPNTYNRIHSNQRFFYLGDFDGDGTMDYLTHLSDGQSYKSFLSFPKNNDYNNLIYQLNGDIINADKVFVLDFDGDGKTELGLIQDVNGNSTCRIFTFQKNGSQVNASLLYASGYPTKWHTFYVGDFNGDGKADFLNRSGNSQWRIGYSTGIDFHEENIPFDFSNAIFQPEFSNLKIGDFNGDGKCDIFYSSYNLNNNYTNVSIYYSQGGNSFIQKNHIYYGYMINSIERPAQILGDYNGDGKLDLLNRMYYLDPVDIISFNPYGKNHLLQKIKNGFNNTVEFDYQLMSSNSNYTKGNSSVYPVMDFQKPIPIVQSIHVPDGIGGTTSNTYTYGEAFFHKQGRGILGFKWIESVSNTLSQKTFLENELVSNAKINVLKKKKVSKTNNIIIRETDYNNSFKLFYSKIYLPLVDEIVDEDQLRDITSISEFTYDNIGRNIKTEVDIGTVESKEITNTYWTGGEWWKKFKITSSNIQTTRSGEYLFLQKFTYGYNNQGGLFMEALNVGDPKGYHKVYHYNLYGNLKDVQVLGFGVQGYRTTDFEYDVKGRFPIKITNSLGQIETISYDMVFAKPKHISTIDGLDSYFEYDGLGRLKKTTNPNGVVINNSFHWDIDLAEKSMFYSQINEQGRPDSKVWYDVFERQVKTQIVGFNQDVYTKTRYNANGNIYQEYAPYFLGSTPVITTYNFDYHNRLSSTNNSIGTTTFTYNYNGGETTITVTDPAGQTKSHTTDPTGKTISVTDNGGTLTYLYFSSGHQKEVALDGLVITSMQVDYFGHQTKLIDKNAGETDYQYNSFGELIFQKDARNNEFTFKYDALGRQISRISNVDGTTNYEYNTSGNGMNQIKKVSAPNGIIQEYTYDHLNRLSTASEIIDNQNFVSYYQYDNFNNLIGITYPSGFKIAKTYNGNGYLSQVKDASSLIDIFTYLEQNAYGQPTKYLLGNGILTEKIYDNYGFPSRYKSGSIHDLKFDFDPTTSNLLSREDAIKGLTENFVYDNLNRLTVSHVLGSTPKTINYSSNGNITHKSDLGNYAYDANKVNAVTSVNLIGGLVYTGAENITYNHFNKTAAISKGAINQEFTYGADFAHKKFVHNNQGNNEVTRYYTPGYEKSIITGITQEVHYIQGGDGLNAIYVIENGVGAIYYVYKDHIESLLTLTDGSGNVVAEQSFDAWGRSRNPIDWNSNSTSIPSWLYRGYTGHERIHGSTLINMNGRIYDPIVARVLSPDNFVQNPLFSQNYNRYSYSFNNPLSYTDPTGDFFVPIIIGAMIGAQIGFIRADRKGENLLGGYLKGALIGGISVGLGQIGGGTYIANVLYGIAQGASIGALDAVLWNEDITESTIRGAIIGGAFAAVSSFPEALRNLNNGYGFNNNLGVFDNLAEDAVNGTIVDPVKAQAALNYWTSRFGGPPLTYDAVVTDTKSASGSIRIGGPKFLGGADHVKRAISHEHGHYYKDIVWRNNKVGGSPTGKWNDNSSIYNHDGVLGYNYAIENSGRYNVSLSAIRDANNLTSKFSFQAWNNYGILKWWHLIPMRFF